MADEQDNADKTEAPTAKKLDDAAKRGDVPIAADIRHMMMLGAALAMLAGGAVGTVAAVARLSRGLWGRAEQYSIEEGGLRPLLASLLAETGRALAVPLLLCLLAAIVAGALQGRFVVASERIAPRLSRISPIAGLGRLFGLQSLVQFGKTLLKLGAIGLAVWLVGWPAGVRLHLLSAQPLSGSASALTEVMHRMLMAAAIAAAAVAAVDYGTTRIQFLKRMRMSREELRDEFKNSDGDPFIKAKLKALRLQRGRRRMLAQVPKAAVVVMNPTHYAVALAYQHGVSAAPIVVARGVDLVALAIRKRAEESKVPVVVDPPLARALYAKGQLDQPIPVELYRAAAEVISFVLRAASRRRLA